MRSSLNDAQPLPGLLGSHLSVAGGMHLAVHEARRLGLTALQVFTKNQQQWAAPPLAQAAVDQWRSALAQIGWTGPGPCRLVSHASYLINLASPDDALWRKSVDLMTVEIERCAALGIGLLVHHPGSHMGTGVNAGIDRIADAYRELFTRTAGAAVVSCLEATVGSGNHLGGRFEELRDLRQAIIAATGNTARVGYCIDTCHIHAAGYDLSTEASARDALSQLAQVCGLEHVRCLHLNDSKAPAGSRRDLHEHIGRGTIGPAGFAPFLREPAFAGAPMIMETPKGPPELDKARTSLPPEKWPVAWDQINADALRAIAAGHTPTLVQTAAGAPAAKPAAKPAKPAKSAKPAKPTKPAKAAKAAKPAKAPPGKKMAARGGPSAAAGKRPRTRA